MGAVGEVAHRVETVVVLGWGAAVARRVVVVLLAELLDLHVIHVLVHLHGGQRVEDEHGEQILDHVALLDEEALADCAANRSTEDREEEVERPAEVGEAVKSGLTAQQPDPRVERHGERDPHAPGARAVEAAVCAPDVEPRDEDGGDQLEEALGWPEPLEDIVVESGPVRVHVARLLLDSAPKRNAEKVEQHCVREPSCD